MSAYGVTAQQES